MTQICSVGLYELASLNNSFLNINVTHVYCTKRHNRAYAVICFANLNLPQMTSIYKKKYMGIHA